MTERREEVRALLLRLRECGSNVGASVLADQVEAMFAATEKERDEARVDAAELATLRTLHARGGWAAELDTALSDLAAARCERDEARRALEATSDHQLLKAMTSARWEAEAAQSAVDALPSPPIDALTPEPKS